MPLYPSAGLFPGAGVWPGTPQVIRGVFIGPTVDVPFRMEGGLYGSLPFGLAVWRTDGVWHQGLSPSAETRAAADVFYDGGRSYPLDLDQIADLAAGGYADYITLEGM